MVRFWEFGFPLPEQQKHFIGLAGQHYDVDFYWKEIDSIGESDGRIKYEDPRYLRGRTPEQALWDEKQREDELRAQVSGFIRWPWDEAWRGTPLARRLERAGLRRRP